MRKIKKGSEVIVISGRDKKRRGTVLGFVGGDKVVVENVNVCKKTVRPNPKTGETGGIISKEMPMHISNVMLYDQGLNKRGRVKLLRAEDGGKERRFKHSGELIV